MTISKDKLNWEWENTQKYPSLEEVLDYENTEVVFGLIRALNISEQEARLLFRDCLKWLWYCNVPDTENHRSIDTPLLIIDEVWHTFILYTYDYLTFCKDFFGHYKHHQPTSEKDFNNFNEIDKREVLSRRRAQMEKVYDLLGKETFIKWYHIYPETYSLENILKLRLK